MTDGLAAMQAQRENAKKSSRRIPPPRHRPKTDEPTPPKAKTLERSNATTSRQVVEPDNPLVRLTVYLDSVGEAWLDEVNIMGRRAHKAGDTSRSAVLRLAVERLMASMEPKEVVEEMQRRAASTTSRGGRKRI